MKALTLAFAAQVFISLTSFSQSAENISLIQIEAIPERSEYALTGSEFVESIKYLQGEEREKAIVDQILAGNLPEFQRLLVPIQEKRQIKGKGLVTLTYYVMPDYLAVGSDEDYIRVPINLFSARLIAQQFNFILPTRHMVNRIYQQAQIKLRPKPMKPGAQMTSTRYFNRHNETINGQLYDRQEYLGQLVAGHKKDVVQSNKLVHKPSAIAIYGWHQNNHKTIQPLSTVHGAYYADYSHGIRLVSQLATWEINGFTTLVHLEDILSGKNHRFLSDEGPINAAPASGQSLSSNI